MGHPLLIGLTSPYFGSTYGGGEKYLGVTAEAVRDGFPGNRVEIVGTVPADRRRYEKALNLDLHGIELTAGVARVTPVHRVANRLAPLRPLRDRVLAARSARGSERFDLHLAMAYRIAVHTRSKRGVILCQFPYRSQEGVDEFQQVICQSDYVQRWVREYWDRDAVVVNPPIDLPASPPDLDTKERLILTVGRFFSGGHSKRHDVMVEAFKRLCDAGLEGWELHLAGSIHREGPHAGYFEKVVGQAEGYPIRIHTGLHHRQLEDLYRRAAIYWHAAGYGAGGDPEASEHFGMTVAEAMAQGAVPLVHPGGGVAEVVADSQDGFHWRDPVELEEMTQRLIRDEELRRELAAAAIRSAERFSRAEFNRRMLAALRPLLA
jgi:glycosyltransferase involved in cell wall biosynthesis